MPNNARPNRPRYTGNSKRRKKSKPNPKIPRRKIHRQQQKRRKTNNIPHRNDTNHGYNKLPTLKRRPQKNHRVRLYPIYGTNIPQIQRNSIPRSNKHIKKQ